MYTFDVVWLSGALQLDKIDDYGTSKIQYTYVYNNITYRTVSLCVGRELQLLGVCGWRENNVTVRVEQRSCQYVAACRLVQWPSNIYLSIAFQKRLVYAKS